MYRQKRGPTVQRGLPRPRYSLPVVGVPLDGEIRPVLQTPRPPYALESPTFRFAAVAALAGRLPLGAGREPILAVLLAARIADAAANPATLSPSVRKARAAAAQQWLSATCPDGKVRAACAALADASVAADRDVAAAALVKVMEVTDGFLDTAARSELRGLLAAFRQTNAGHPE